ncbi:phosphotransferase [Bosea sp. BH3]|uniref:phosphotransferase n=1 Tax=Bosea sp. BH3 TaxID=2871701 RepID=UPI0021CB0692|nr:phosphotransferase [Bosea sp. BH3]MCU4181505.1 phosphotransferase [Bosea sp. BH3]
MAAAFDDIIPSFLRASGLVADPAAARLTPLTGGVASDIWKVEADGRVFAVKKALPQLRVAQTWLAPVSRNASEVEWLREAGRIVPGVVPEILASDAEAGVFAMSYLDPADHPVWKQELRAGRADAAFAAKLGRTIAAIHAGTAGSPEIARRFDNEETFHSIRLEPYLEATARVHADLSGPLLALAHDTLCAKLTLVHGDVSPKNILVGPDGPVILDAECAWYGDPAFDLAFCLNHLLLKCLWTPAARAEFLACFDALAQAYLAGVNWEAPAAVEERIARLLPALFLARVDGKSPAEYVTAEADKERIRRIARPLVAWPPRRLSEIRAAWAEEVSA